MNHRYAFRPTMWLLLLALALLVRAVVPQGYMASADAAGSITVEICNSDAVWSIPLDGKPEAPESRDKGHCAFAGMQGDGALPAPLYAVPVFATAASPAMPDARIIAALAQRPKPPARGPPVSV